MTISDLPVVNASLNAASTVLLVAGWFCIRRGNKRAHITCMVSALVTSTVFLTCYLIYHAHVGSVKFTHPGAVRTLYFAILLTHTPLAACVLPLVGFTVVPALRERFDRHKRIARWTLPVWLYVSLTGVLIYFMLYQWFPPEEVLKQRAAVTSQLPTTR